MQNWTAVTTTNLPGWQIIGHAKHLLSQGAHKPIYFLDNPEIHVSHDIQNLKEYVRFVLCDESYWQKLGGMPDRLAHRQLVNLRVARANCSCDWFLHIDSDEYLHSETDLNDLFKNLPNEVVELRLQNCERVTRQNDPFWHTGSLRMPCWKSDLLLNYKENLRQFLAFGLANYFHGKSFVKKAPNLTQGIHGAIRKSDFDVIRLNLPIHEGFIAHYQYLGHEKFYFKVLDLRNRSDFFFEHEKRQMNWLSNHYFDKARIMEFASMMFVAGDDELEKWRQSGLHKDIPISLLKRIEDSFTEAQLKFNVTDIIR